MKETLKHRLIGAAVLTAVAVLFLPGFFKDKQHYEVDTQSRIPGRPSITAVDFNEPIQSGEVDAAPAPETMFMPPESDTTEPVAVASPTVPASAISSPARSASFSSATINESVAEMPLNAQGLPNAWVIQVASLGNKEAATKLRDQLQAEGHKAYLRSVVNGNATIYRIFIGPKLDKAQTLAIKTELDKRLNVNSLVLPFKP